MNIYKERNKRSMRYDRNRNEAQKSDDSASKRVDYVEYTNMSSYERYLRNKENDSRSDKYIAERENGRVYPDRYGYDERDSYNYGYRGERYDYSYRDRDRYANNSRRPYDGDGYYDYRDNYEERFDNDYRPQRRNKKSKKSLSAKAKIMIGIYMLIVLAIVALIIYNVLPGVKADKSVQVPDSVSFNQNVLNVTESGEKLDKVDGVVSDESDGDSNWFDNMLDSFE